MGEECSCRLDLNRCTVLIVSGACIETVFLVHVTWPSSIGRFRRRNDARSSASAPHFDTCTLRFTTCKFGPPKTEQRRPGSVPVLTPNPVQGDPVIDFSRAQQPLARFRTAVALTDLERSNLVARRRPELPGNDAGRMPYGVFVRGAASPEIRMPAQAVDWLPTDAAMTWAARMKRLPIGCRRLSKGRG